MRYFSLKIFLFALLGVVNIGNAIAAEPSLHYLVREPKVKTAHPPLLILMHGVNSNEQDLFSLADQLPDKYLVISAQGPYKLGGNGYAWYHADFSVSPAIINKEEAEKTRELIITFIGQLKGKYTFDESKVFLCGFSQGAIMSYSVGLTHPDKIKGIAVMSGRILDEVKPKVVAGKQLKQLSVFISHGTKDKVLAVQQARDANLYLAKLGVYATYKEYMDGHTINREMFGDLVEWLNKQ